MSAAETVVQRFLDEEEDTLGASAQPHLAGGRASVAAEPTRQLREAVRQQLIGDLAVIERRNEWYFRVCVALVAILFLASTAIVILYAGRPNIVKTAGSGLGASSFGVAILAFRMWREKFYVGSLLRLAVDLQGEALSAAIRVLAGAGTSPSPRGPLPRRR